MAKETEAASVEPRLDPDIEGIVDRSTLDPDYHYRFTQERPQRISRLRAKGYTLVSASADGVKTIIGDDIPADDRIRDGDTVLMKIPKERFMEGRRKVAKLTRGRLAVPTAQFRKKTRGAGPGGEDITVITKADKE